MAGQNGVMKSGGAPRSPLQTIIYWGMVLSIWGAIFAVVFFAVMAFDLPDTSSLEHPKKEPSITYLDRSGALIAVRGSQAAPPIDIDKLPNYVPLAFVAIEDRRFFNHPGFDPIGMGRAVFRNIFKKKNANLAGGSTITQQLARNLFLSADQNIKRKAQELMIAVWLEAKYSKKEILALYLNRVYFGAGAYGIEAASQRYFNKEAKDLTIGEAAMLAGMMKGPSSYSPLSNKERAGRRALIVLNEMVEAKVITKVQRDEALKQPITISKTLATAHAQYFVDWIDGIVRQEIGKFDDDLIVETTLDLQIQTDAEKAVTQILARDVKKKVEQAALISVDGEGRIRAMIGGANYADSEFNRATRAHRQAGSTFKPFVYLTAMEAGYAPSSPVIDEPYSIGDWAPENYTKKYMGQITLETALANSVNTVAARLANDIGRPNVARVVRRMGVKAPINTDPAMALGTAEFTPIEMAQAYTPFANGGLYADAHGITRIRTAHTGKVLYQYVIGDENGQRKRVIDNPSLMYMNQMMRSVIDHGTGTGVKMTGYDIAGKTGTTSDYRDAWFVGYTGGFVTVVWVGRDDNTQMVKVTGGSTPAAIWKTYMQSALKRIKVTSIPDGPAATITDGPVKSLIEGYDASMAAASAQVEEQPQGTYNPPMVTMEPIANPEEKSKDQKTLDEVFADAEKKH